MEKNLKTNSKKVAREKNGQLKKGVVLNPAGRPKGSLHFKTKFFAVIDKIAKENKLTAQDVEDQLMIIGYKKAKGGNFNFWNDLMNRLYGKPLQTNEVEFDVGQSLFEILKKGNHDHRPRK